MKKTVSLLMLIAIFSKTTGFIRDIALSYFYGASGVSDAYLISNTIPFVIFEFIGVGIATSYIPMYNKIEILEGEKEANRYTNNIIHIILAASTLLLIFGIVFTMPIVKLFASGFKGYTLDLAITFTRISLVSIYFTGLVSIFSGFLQIKKSFILPALIGLPLNLLTIISIFLSFRSGNVLVLAIGTVIGSVFQVLLLLPLVFKKGYQYEHILNVNDEYIKDMLYLALPVIIGVSINQINILVDRTIASQITEGGISALSYASRLNGFFQAVFVLSFTTVLYPRISRMVAENNIIGLKKSVSDAIVGINLLIIPTTVMSMMFSGPIINILFNRGNFSTEAVIMTSSAFYFYTVGMIGFGLREVLSRAFYSLQDTKTPAINAAIAMGLNVILNIILSKYLGVGGLALGTSISAIIATLLLFISLRRKIGSLGAKKLIISSTKIIIASLVMGLVAGLIYKLSTSIGEIRIEAGLILALAVGAFVYSLIIYFIKIEEVNALIKLVRKK